MDRAIKIKDFIKLLVVWFLFQGIFSIADEMTITTYYPSPYGVYNRLRTRGSTYLATDPAATVTIGGTSASTYKLDLVPIAGSVQDLFRIGSGLTVKKDSSDVFDYVFNNGRVGIGITLPQANLDIGNVSAPDGGNSLGTAPWLRAGDGSDGGRMWIQYANTGSGVGTSAAPLLVLSGKNNPPRIQFQQVGTQTEASPRFSSWIGHSSSNRDDIAIMGARNVGINTITPSYIFDVVRTGAVGAAGFHHVIAGRKDTGGGVLMGYISDGAQVTAGAINSIQTYDLHLGNLSGNPSALVILNSNGNVGIGNPAPQSTLQVGAGNLPGYYIQIPFRTAGGAPPAADCANQGQAARMLYDGNTNLLWICRYDPGTGVSNWVSVAASP